MVTMVSKKSSGRSKRAPTGNGVAVHVEHPSSGKGEFKMVGGCRLDKWNHGLIDQIASALPQSQGGLTAEGLTAAEGALAAQADINPHDPVEGLDRLRNAGGERGGAWISIDERGYRSKPSRLQTKYLALADKAARTVAMLCDTLDRHRGRGQQQILVKHQHVTVNADQAVVADTVVNGHGRPGGVGRKRKSSSTPCTWPMHQATRCKALDRNAPGCRVGRRRLGVTVSAGCMAHAAARRRAS